MTPLSFAGLYRGVGRVVRVLRRLHEMHLLGAHCQPLETCDTFTLFEQVRIPSPAKRLDAYSHEMSGGMRQRAMIALVLACNPQVLLAIEPTTALDATVRAQILLLMRDRQRLSMIFVTHNISVGVEVADRIAVMYGVRIVEIGAVRDVIRTPRHPYTIGLILTRPHCRRHAGNRLPAGRLTWPTCRPAVLSRRSTLRRATPAGYQGPSRWNSRRGIWCAVCMPI